ncbi:stage III sporulation protein AG [Rossellomorea vietnamensis]|uniref:Stage III sporulation protein AG n=1 Tax=Rossellomorea vietnamensis TaxID=218284 RepID=A0A5D4MGR1_9BACI|nr:stage III sporulation protein AG [Rossellomorea vietnamensis]TYS00698.1 stage III sporulation protein AG [Rossellomorea vietnamensis]
MKFDKGPLQFLKDLFAKESEEKTEPGKKAGKYHYFLIVLLFGVAIMLISDMWSGGNQETAMVMETGTQPEEEDVPAFGKKDSKDSVMEEYEDRYENQLREALEDIAGVSDPTIVINVESTERKVYQKDTSSQTQLTKETDREGGNRSIEDKTSDEKLVIIRDGEKEVPVILETKKPKISGVLVVAKGADNIQVKKWIIESVTRVLDVPSHRVAVMPKN